MIEMQVDTHEDFIAIYLDYWQMTNLPRDMWIPAKERMFMIHTMALNLYGISINSQEYKEEIQRRMRIKTDNQVYNYRTRLRKKGFLIEENGITSLPQALNLEHIPKKAMFRFTVNCTVSAPATNRPKIPVKQTAIPNNPPEPPPPPKVPELDEYSTNAYDAAEKFKAGSIRYDEPPVVKKEVQRSGGYSDPGYSKMMAERDREKLPPIDDNINDDINSNVRVEKEPEYKEPKYNIIDLDD